MPIKVTHRKLGKHQADGLAWVDDNHIEIDSTLKGEEHLYVFIHETMHILNPKWAEAKIVHHAKILAQMLWDQSYRKVDL